MFMNEEYFTATTNQAVKQEQEKKDMSGLFGLIGTGIENIDDIVFAFDKDAQSNQIELAKQNARIAEANASGVKAPSRNNSLIIGGVVLAIVIVAVLIFKKK